MPTTRGKKGKPAAADKDSDTNPSGEKTDDTIQPILDNNKTITEEEDGGTNNTKVPENMEVNKDQDDSLILPKDPSK